MIHYLPKIRAFRQRLTWLSTAVFCVVGLLSSTDSLGQQLETQPLAVTSVCPGSTIDVTGVRSFAGGDFSIELSNGSGYTEIPSVFISSSGRYEITYRATIPAATPAASTYRIRIVSKNPAIVGTPSESILTVNPKPALPVVPAEVTACSTSDGTGTVTVAISVSASSATAITRLYTSGGSVVNTVTGSTATNLLKLPNGSATTFYYISQEINGCESDKKEVKVVVKPLPVAPTVQSIAICQNTTAPALQATGQNLSWYTTDTGGTGSLTAPVLSSAQAGLTNYYVSQRVDGCEGPRAILSVLVNALPAAPGVTAKTLCLLAAPERATATGEGLVWYMGDGSKVTTAPLLATDKVTSYTVQVAQTMNGCEGPKAILSVNVQTTPVPTVTRTTVEICRGATAQPLEAAGTNLKWTDPNGKVTTTAPTPPALEATARPEGDVYYVTQTGENGCESVKVPIYVFVQTTPTMTVLGSTTTNLGLEVPLKLVFNGVGPYRYKLTNGLSGTSIKDTTILVLPTRTTTYQVAEVANKCGIELPANGSSATITVLVPTIQTLFLPSTTLCAGTSLTTPFVTTGTFNTGSVFKLQLAKIETDSTKIVFVDALNSQIENGKISGIVSASTAGGMYWVRVIATNPKIPIVGNNSPTLLTIRSLPTATLTGNQTLFEGQPAQLSVAFTGDGPWSFTYRDSTSIGLGTVATVSTSANPKEFVVNPQKTTSYLLTGVSNSCGNGTILRRLAVVTLIPVLGVEDQTLADAVDVYPIPATTTLTVRIRGLSATEPAVLELTDLTGRVTRRQETRQSTSSLELNQQPAGVYILHIKVGDRMASRRIVKL